MTNPLNPLYDAVAWVIVQIHAMWSLIIPANSGAAWVLSIVLLVVVMRLLLLPLFIKQMHSMRQMSALAPHLQELRKKYKNDRQTMNEETMKLYKEHGVNPLGGCLPLVAQLPLFFALFGVLRGISVWTPYKPGTHIRQAPPYGLTQQLIESAQHASIFGARISDKVLFTGTLHVPLHAKVVILCTVAISVITTFLTVRQSTKRGMTPQMTPDNPMASSQKYMTYIVPLFALSGLYWQFGLVFYWVATNVWTLGQQHVLFRRFPPPATATAAAAAAPAAPKSGTKPASGAGAAPRKTGQGTTRTGTAAKTGTSGAKTATSAADARKAPASAKPARATAGTAARAKATQGKAAEDAEPVEDAVPASYDPAVDAVLPAKKPVTGAAPRNKNPRSGQAGTPARRPVSTKSSQSATSSAKAAANGSGLLRRLGRRPAEEEQPETREVKIVRQQRTHQPRSKRSGKR
ncbi:MAG TPA: membrane protein insertase YidC [Streptosporangiaceae bacterium]|nr:membrane protein insertase YidC [Streptosporangiaceae bacterium]